MDGWKDVWTEDRQTDRWVDRQVGVWTDEQMDG